MRPGLLFLNNRYHDPVLGTFISVDPLVAKTGEPYIYGSGNPTTLSDPSGLDPDTNAAIRATAKKNGHCTYSAAASAGNVCGPTNSRFYGTIGGGPASELDAFELGELRSRVSAALADAFSTRTESAPPNASLGPDASPFEYEVAGPGYSDSEALDSLASLYGSPLLARVLDWISAPGAVNQGWPEEFDELAGTKIIDWVGPHQVDACGTAATGATVFCVAAQRLPVGRPEALAVTFGHFVFYDVDEAAAVANDDGTYSIHPGWLAHEMVHVAQYEILGDSFFEHYAVDDARLEYEAYEVFGR